MIYRATSCVCVCSGVVLAMMLDLDIQTVDMEFVIMNNFELIQDIDVDDEVVLDLASVKEDLADLLSTIWDPDSRRIVIWSLMRLRAVLN